MAEENEGQESGASKSDCTSQEGRMSGGKIAVLVVAILLVILGGCLLIFGVGVIASGGSPSGEFYEIGPLSLLIAAVIFSLAVPLGLFANRRFFAVAAVVAVLTGIIFFRLFYRLFGQYSLVTWIALAVLALIIDVVLRAKKRKI
jgi:hypothetical protein